ncbi:MAG: SDR family NAD(P)-dependent oxidoreductase, partial [Ornithinimicrobium sp.]
MRPPRLSPLQYSGGTAVITGAAGGIGEQLAHQLAASGSHLALVDRKAEPLQHLATQLRTSYPRLRISAHPVDLGDGSAVEGLVGDVLDDHDGITVLVNNAGVALAGTFEQLSIADVDWLLRINLHAPIALTKAFLPSLTAHGGGHVVNISSLFGLVAPAGQTAYATSKFGLRGFSEALRSELVDHGVGVTTVHPGGVATRIAADSRTGAGLGPAAAQAGREAFGRLLTMD